MRPDTDKKPNVRYLGVPDSKGWDRKWWVREGRQVQVLASPAQTQRLGRLRAKGNQESAL